MSETCDYPGVGCLPPEIVEQGYPAYEATHTVIHADQPSGTLPFTGGDAIGLAIIGILCLVAGAVKVRFSRS